MRSIVSIVLLLIVFMFFLNFNPLILRILILLASLFIYFGLRQILSSWIGIALILIFLGGIIIIFLYITRLTSREKFLVKKNYLFIFFFFFNFQYLRLNEKNFFFENLKELYFLEKFLVILLIIRYLLISLILLVKISENFKGALIKQF